jgi:hypothetical protein
LAKPEGQEETRARLFGEVLPEIGLGERLTEVWRELGYAKSGSHGAVPFDFAEVDAFNRLTDCNLSPHEAMCLIDMSRAYCVEVAERNPLRVAPMEREQ